MSSASANEVEDFLNGPLVAWLESCLPRPEIFSGYPSLLDGTVIHTVWLQIDPEPQNHPTKLDNQDETYLSNSRAKNFDSIVKNLKTLYEEELGQTVLVFPDCSILGMSPDSRAGLEQMKLLLVLLLGAAVQCPNKEIFIGRIKELDVVTQHVIVEFIKQVTDNQTLVIGNDSVEQIAPDRMYHHIIRIAKERDRYHSNWISSLTAEMEVKNSIASSSNSSTPSVTENNHMAVELADLKSKLRKFRQELEEKSEAFMEVKEELDHKNSQLEKLRTESQEWYTESRRAAAYRDEVDVLRERAERADRLEIEVQRIREKLSDAEFFKTRVDELREDNRMLLETKDMLEEQLQRSRKRSEHAMGLETEIIKYKQKLNDMALERDADKTKLQELVDENTQLQLTTKSFCNLSIDAPLSDEECASGDNSLSEQLTNNAQTRALKLELENRRLQQSLDTMKESSFHESANKILDLEKEKKKLSLKVDQLHDNCTRLTSQNQELEIVFKNALEENKKLQDSMDNRQIANERQIQEREADRLKLSDLDKHIETLTKEKHRIQTLCESVQRRADDLERFLDSKTKECAMLQPRANECETMRNELAEVKHKVTSLERENANMNKDVCKLRENLETKDVLLDRNDCQIATQTKDIQNLTKQLDDTVTIYQRVQELESQNEEMASQSKIYKETISTLRRDLVAGTLETEKVNKELEKLGIENREISTTGVNVETVVQKLVKNPETFKTVREIMLSVNRDITGPLSGKCVLCHKQETYTVEKNFEISNAIDADIIVGTRPSIVLTTTISHQPLQEQCDKLRATNAELQISVEALQAENARQKVDVSTLGSQITSLNTQHVALQLANSQLASEKDVLCKRADCFKQQNESLLHDQVTLQCLHEQLNSEYEALCCEKELLKTTLRDLRKDNRDLREREQSFISQEEKLQNQINMTRKETDDLTNLRAEHSKLKLDFRNLYTSSEYLKNEYKNMQTQYKSIRADNSRLKLQKTELTGELNSRTDAANALEIEMTKCAHRCEMLLQMNANLDTDRRTLMEHVSQLLSQYHELLSHSLDDKQHYHDEEKLFTDKMNNLSRQKEKLEEKIMEHYRKLESCSPKKKAFGASFVKRVKKASSDLISKVPSRNRRSWIDDSRLTQSQIALESESGGNESDNSMEEPNSVASDTHLLQRNVHLRQSLQRKPDNAAPTLARGGLRNSCQTLKREDSSRSHRNSIHGLEPPDVTGSSLTLGTAGSRRTVYLIDDNATKLPDTSGTTNPNNSSSSNNTSTATPPSTDTSATAASTTINSSVDANNPSTFLMYNRISNVIGGPVVDSAAVAGATATGGSSIPTNGFSSNTSDSNKNAKDKKNIDDKESAIWYEYGCV